MTNSSCQVFCKVKEKAGVGGTERRSELQPTITKTGNPPKLHPCRYIKRHGVHMLVSVLKGKQTLAGDFLQALFPSNGSQESDQKDQAMTVQNAVQKEVKE